MCIVKVYILPCVILFAGMGQVEMKMDNKELSEEERNAIKKFANILVKFVLDETEHDKKCTNSKNNDPHIKELVRNIAGDLFEGIPSREMLIDLLLKEAGF